MTAVDWKKAPRDGASRRENLGTQPLQTHKVFNNPDVITEAWWPVCRSTALARGEARSFKITHQRIVVFRGEDQRARALDAFCPHMGADLGNGRVVDNAIECYFHRWRYDAQGALIGIRAESECPKGIALNAWPTEEKYGFVWVYSGRVAPYPVPSAPGLEGDDVLSWHFASPLLFAHHHVMMAGGIDLLHFATVHDLDVRFEVQLEEHDAQRIDWKLEGVLPNDGWRARLGRWLIGDRFRYTARFAGGSVVALTYGVDQRLGGNGRPLSPLHILWGCVAEPSGVSRVHVWLLTRRRRGLGGWILSRLLLLFTALLLTVLRDDDVKAFPNMRFQPSRLIAEDQSVARFIQFVNRLPASVWSRPAREAE